MHNTGCQGSCRASAKGVGLSLNCSSDTIPFDLIEGQSSTSGPYNAGNDPAIVNGTYIYQSTFDWFGDAADWQRVNVTYKATAPCNGTLLTQQCIITPVLVLYSIVIDGNVSTISLDPQTSIHDDIFQQSYDEWSLDPVSNIQGPCTLGGYWLALYNKFDSSTHMNFGGAVGYELQSTGNAATQYAITDGADATRDSSYEIATSCSLTFRDPMPDLLAGARNLMFRAAVAAFNNSTMESQTVTARQRRWA